MKKKGLVDLVPSREFGQILPQFYKSILWAIRQVCGVFAVIFDIWESVWVSVSA